MKKIYLLFVAAILVACSAEPIQDELISLDAAVTGKSKVTAKVSANEFVVPSLICAGEDADFLINAEVGSNIQVQQEIEGEWVQVAKTSSSSTNPFLVVLNFENPGEYKLRYKVGSGGFSNAYVITVQNCGCEESFTYLDNGNMTYTFTYVPKEDVDSAEMVFTFAQGVDVDGLGGWEGNGQTRKMVMDLTACITYSWTITLDANCSGKSGSSNVWTDFNVNDVSKKADQEDKFVQACN